MRRTTRRYTVLAPLLHRSESRWRNRSDKVGRVDGTTISERGARRWRNSAQSSFCAMFRVVFGEEVPHACPLDTSPNAARASKYIAHCCTPKSYDFIRAAITCNRTATTRTRSGTTCTRSATIRTTTATSPLQLCTYPFHLLLPSQLLLPSSYFSLPVYCCSFSLTLTVTYPLQLLVPFSYLP